MPRVQRFSLRKHEKFVVTTVAVGTPAFSSLTESWILHDVQEPQSAKALMTTSQRAISSGRQSAPVRVIFLRDKLNTVVSLLEQLADMTRNLSALGLLLSSKPMRRP